MAWTRPPLDPAFAPLMEEWRKRQLELAAASADAPIRPLPRLVAGADSALSPDRSWMLSVVVVYDRETRRIVEIARGSAPADIPYIPGYLGFREGPALLAAFRGVRSPFGAVLFDGMGRAHPRRCGIAVQMGVTLDVPAIGVGKSRLYGRHKEPGWAAGSSEPLWDGKERIGIVLRTRDGVKPLYISVGHKADLATATELVLACRGGYRLPEPTRLADKEAARFKAEWAGLGNRIPAAS
jgi:deoxyribonuclease V